MYSMFAVHNVMSCPALVRKLVFGFYKRVKASQNSIVQVEPTGISCYGQGIGSFYMLLLHFSIVT